MVPYANRAEGGGLTLEQPGSTSGAGLRSLVGLYGVKEGPYGKAWR